jgi:hypothetical protein
VIKKSNIGKRQQAIEESLWKKAIEEVEQETPSLLKTKFDPAHSNFTKRKTRIMDSHGIKTFTHDNAHTQIFPVDEVRI